VEKYRNPNGQLKENLFLPLFNTNFISKLSIWQHAGKGMRHFNPLEDYRIFHHWFSWVKNTVIMGKMMIDILGTWQVYPFGTHHLLYISISITLLIYIYFWFNIIAYHSRGGYISITETRNTLLPDIFIKAASEIGLDEVDVNGKEILGKIVHKCQRKQSGNQK
jgi:hypothetical protein